MVLRLPSWLGRVWLRRLAIATAVILVVAAIWVALPFWQLSGQFTDQPVRQPSRLYGQAIELERGERVSISRLVEELEEGGYRAAPEGESLIPGQFRRRSDGIEVFLRTFPTRAGQAGGRILDLEVRGSRITRLLLGDSEVEQTSLEPPLIASFYGDDVKERRAVGVDRVPEDLIEAVLAAEDSRFFDHSGLSIRGIARAAWVNLRGGEVRQGGSTLTQQLVKNLYLTHDRTLARKAREAVLAVMLELRYSKRQILQAYLNEIYMGSVGGVNVIGMGAAARVYFSKDVGQLDLGEAAILAGMIRSPASTMPVGDNLETTQSRRDQILDRMAELEWVDEARRDTAKARAVRSSPQVPIRRRAPYFADMVRAEAERRFGIRDLNDTGYSLLTTLDWRSQRKAREAVGWGLDALETGWEKGHDVAGPLQAALVSVDPMSGAVRAYVGGRDYGASQFDRVSQMRRQAGSAFKPVVYAAAFEAGVATPASLLDDSPVTIRLAGRQWTPKNDDGNYHGWVTARAGLERSLNVATARLALQTDLERIIELARGLGVTARLEPFPSLALGAFELTPLEMATVYATLAAGGQRPPIHAVDTVFDRQGARVDGLALPEPEPVLSAQTAFVLTSVLQGVLDRGTARSVRSQGLRDPLAGKSGTTNKRRDSWFAGYSPNRSSVVWVGYDDNSSTRLSGSRAALPIWARFMVADRPPGGYSVFSQPPGIATATIDPETGELATGDCPEVFTEVFFEGYQPTSICHLHGDWWERRYRTAEDERYERRQERRRMPRWLRKIFGRNERPNQDEERNERPDREGRRRADEPPPAGDRSSPNGS